MARNISRMKASPPAKTTNIAWGNPLKKIRDNKKVDIPAGRNTIPSASKQRQKLEDYEKQIRGY